ncbi:MAG: SHOCT domain-containing protein [Nocardioidaceae bacterium]
MVTLWGLLIVTVYRLVTRSPHGTDAGRDDPRRILARRLARGEIDADEYRRLRAELETDDGSHSDSQDR